MNTTAKAAVATRQLETERVIVTEWRFAPGAETGWHRHAHDYIVVPISSGTLRLESAAGSQEAELKLGASYHRPAGVEHNVINASNSELAFVEIELKA